jgi:tRNA-Thr(GGU) m(6)t(6)A37 methyltransferase TsaA
MELKVIAYARNGFTDKFGIPRQSREESGIETRIVFEPEFSAREAIRGIEGFSHLWLLWGFSEISRNCLDNVSSINDVNAMHWRPTVRPPRLGGNKRVGVFATRSPFRPNPIGLTSVRLLKIENGQLIVSGADLLDGTPIYDIKPYLSFSDSHPDAKNGFAEDTKNYHLEVTLPKREALSEWPDEKTMKDIVEILRQDPRPAYQEDPTREYKMDYSGWCVTFVVEGPILTIRNLSKGANMA